jgi:hypothetical protein
MGGVKNGELTFKTQKRGGTMKQKRRPLGETLKEGTKSHLNIL